MYLLDTMVISELRRARPHGGVLAWPKSIDDADLRISAVTLGEIQAGIELTRKQNPPRAAELEAWLDVVAASWNVLPMDGAIFRRWAQLMHGRSDGRIEDAMIPATAAVHGLMVLTRNVRDFRPFGIKTLDPFKAA
ncbi:MAG: type II toxin-antitoxin system VapC family toxin [Caulobacterales bacterium]|jgi:predicted nucleic acid-binding protein